MKITFNGQPENPTKYTKNSALKAKWFYVDDDGDLVITDWTGKAVAVVTKTTHEVYGAGSISWPIYDTEINQVTITR